MDAKARRHRKFTVPSLIPLLLAVAAKPPRLDPDSPLPPILLRNETAENPAGPPRKPRSGPAEPDVPTLARARFVMGTVFQVEAPAGADPEKTAEALEAALDRVEDLEAILSNWREDSELCRLNRRAAAGPVPISRDLLRAIEASLRWARETGGSFDPAVEPLTRGFRPVPGGAPIAVPVGPASFGLAAPTWQAVHLDPASGTARFASGVQGLDLGGIGKGYALDQAAEVLARRGVRSALLDAGGQLLALDPPPGRNGWQVAIADPSERRRAAMPFLLRNASAATSGNAERPGEILDPMSGKPIEYRGSATAVAPDGTAADALSTGLFVMGPAKGLSWAKGRSDVLALYLEPNASPGKPPALRSSRPLRRGKGTILQIAFLNRRGRRVLSVGAW